jgi:hypothetical protein
MSGLLLIHEPEHPAPLGQGRVRSGPVGCVLVEIPGVLRLAEIISVVHIWRMVKTAAVASSAAASFSVARGVRRRSRPDWAFPVVARGLT